MLTLEIEYLLGVSFATSEGNTEVAEWPPSFARTFSALVAAFAARGSRSEERGALEWLEAQSAPRIGASEARQRTLATVFVPVNDAFTARGSGKGNIHVMPGRRGRQPRQFPATRPVDPVVRFVWTVDPTAAVFGALDAIARDVVYIGHSSSLTRARFILGDFDGGAFSSVTRAVYAGRLAELERAYHADQRPSGALPLAIPVKPENPPPTSYFGTAPIVFADAGGVAPDVRAATLACKRLRDTLLSAFGRCNPEIPTWLSGHERDGTVTRQPHAAIIPLLDIGYQYSSGRIMGLALVWPSVTVDEQYAREALLLKALASLANDDAKPINGAPIVDLRFAHGVWKVVPVDDYEKSSLRPRRYLGVGKDHVAQRWATVTPIALDRHLRAKNGLERQREAEAVVGLACLNIGLPAPIDIATDKHSAVTGVVSAYPSTGGPPWTGWAMTHALRNRQLTHAIFEFSEPVRGPVILGAGRFTGLGLCLPIDEIAR